MFRSCVQFTLNAAGQHQHQDPLLVLMLARWSNITFSPLPAKIRPVVTAYALLPLQCLNSNISGLDREMAFSTICFAYSLCSYAYFVDMWVIGTTGCTQQLVSSSSQFLSVAAEGILK